jgi:hypothetical protein
MTPTAEVGRLNGIEYRLRHSRNCDEFLWSGIESRYWYLWTADPDNPAEYWIYEGEFATKRDALDYLKGLAA